MTGNNLGKNITQAHKQLQDNNNLNKIKKVKGIIALSVDKLLGLDKGIESYDTIESLKDDLHKKMNRLQAEYEPKWKNLLNKNVLGIIFYFHFPVYIISENDLLTNVNFFFLLPLIDYSTRFSEKIVMEKLENLLR